MYIYIYVCIYIYVYMYRYIIYMTTLNICAHTEGQEGTPYLHSFLVPHSISKSVSVFKPVRFQSCCMNQATIPPPPMPPLPVVEVWSSLTFRKQDFWEQNQILPNNLSYGLKQKLLSFKAPAKVCESMRS